MCRGLCIHFFKNKIYSFIHLFRTAIAFADAMLSRDIYVIGFTFPVVPRGKARIRVQLSASHSTEDVNKCVDAFIEVGKDLGTIA